MGKLPFRTKMWGLLSAFFISSPAVADSHKLPDFSDVISVRMPEGYRYAHGEGLFNRFTYEYLPLAETRSDWKEKISLIGLGASVPREALRARLLAYLRNTTSGCPGREIRWLEDDADVSTISTDYLVRCNESLVLPEIESSYPFGAARFRFLNSRSGFYVFKYLMRPIPHMPEGRLYLEEDVFLSTAKAKLDHFNVCDLGRSTTCWVDRDMLGGDSIRETDNTLRCRTDPSADCNPTAMLIFRSDDHVALNSGRERAVAAIYMDQFDLTRPAEGLSLLSDVQSALAAGAPEFVLVVKPSANPNHLVTFEERSQIAAFFNLLGETAVQSDIAESYGSLLLNFH